MKDANGSIRTPQTSDSSRLYWLVRRFLKARAWQKVAQAQMDGLSGPALGLKHPLYLDRYRRLDRTGDLVIRIEATIIDLVTEAVGEAPASMKAGDYLVGVVADELENQPYAAILHMGRTVEAPAYAGACA